MSLPSLTSQVTLKANDDPDLDGFPPAPELMTVTEEMLSPYSKAQAHPHSTQPKLITHLGAKQRYVLHHTSLRLYLSLGLEVETIHSVISFKQSPWLAPYIQFNTDKRTASTSAFDMMYFKLLNNAIYGKLLENKRSHVNVKLCTSKEQLTALSRKLTFKRAVRFSDKLVAVELRVSKVHLNRPMTAGTAVLDISKNVLYNFHYNQFVPKMGGHEAVKLLLTDTDSLFYEVTGPNFHENLTQLAHELDCSALPPDHDLYDIKNKKIPGKFKDELNGQTITRFIGLRSKCYSYDYLSPNGTEKHARRLKGIGRTASRCITSEDFKRVLETGASETSTFQHIKHVKHRLYNEEVSKLSLTPFDNKRYIFANGIDSRAYSSKEILETITEESEEMDIGKQRIIEYCESDSDVDSVATDDDMERWLDESRQDETDENDGDRSDENIFSDDDEEDNDSCDDEPARKTNPFKRFLSLFDCWEPDDPRMQEINRQLELGEVSDEDDILDFDAHVDDASDTENEFIYGEADEQS